MPRYIDADEALRQLENNRKDNPCQPPYRGIWDRASKNAIDTIEAIPIANVVELPCKVGDTVWFIRPGKSNIIETKVNKIVFKRGGIYLQLDCNSLYETSCKSIGKSVFLTQEEAEKALSERI